ncbi:hypothetical protein ScalyP_jg70 [Parmales sp. scaly parma]|nr:hypothetical protein ScalyP_jg70 [Parmales sp. scaly parma]
MVRLIQLATMGLFSMASAYASAEVEDCVNDLLTVETYHLSEGDVTPTTPTLQDRGQASVSPMLSQKLSLGCDSTTCSSIQTRVMTASSALHSDRYVNGDMRGGPLNERVSFLILNDNSQAKFLHGENEVPIKKGSLVTFDGNVKHRTIIDQGVVNLLGPWAVDTKLSVGFDCADYICPGTCKRLSLFEVYDGCSDSSDCGEWECCCSDNNDCNLEIPTCPLPSPPPTESPTASPTASPTNEKKSKSSKGKGKKGKSEGKDKDKKGKSKGKFKENVGPGKSKSGGQPKKGKSKGNPSPAPSVSPTTRKRSFYNDRSKGGLDAQEPFFQDAVIDIAPSSVYSLVTEEAVHFPGLLAAFPGGLCR